MELVRNNKENDLYLDGHGGPVTKSGKSGSHDRYTCRDKSVSVDEWRTEHNEFYGTRPLSSGMRNFDVILASGNRN